MSDNERPRPQFGEYATPEAQRDAIKVPLDHAESIPVQSHESASTHITVQDAPPQQKRASNGDRFATVILLGIGLVTVLMTIPALLNLPEAIASAYSQLGVGTFSSDDLALSLGWGALLTEVVLWIVALWLSLRVLRRGKMAWWIPLVLGVIANIVVVAAITIAMMADPAFMEYVNQMSVAG